MVKVRGILETSKVVLIFETAYKKYFVFEEREDNLKATLESSGFIKCLFKICNDWRKRVTDYLKTSLTVKHTRELKSEFCISPVKSGSIIVVTAILANLFFYALFKNSIQREISLLSWIIQGLLLFAGLAGLFCAVSLEDLKKSSLFLKWIKR